MRKISIHLEYQVVLPRQGPPKARDVRRAEAQLVFAVEDMNAVVVSRDGVDDGSGAIGRSVVDDQYFKAGILGKNRRYQPGDVEAFVEGRDDDERALSQCASDRATAPL